MKTILITGAGGFLGSRLVRRFSAGTSAAPHFPQTEPDAVSPYHVYPLSGRAPDIRDAAGLLALFRQVRPDYVIHCAAVSDTGRCVREPEFSYSVNVIGAENIAIACRASGAKLIFCSSDQVYFDNVRTASPVPHRESEKLYPSGVYGRQKLEAEKRCAAACPDTVSLRLSWMYDTGKPGPEKHGNLVTTLRGLLDNPDPDARLAFPVYDRRSLTDVWDVAINMEAALDLAPGVYNFGSPNPLNTYETAAVFLSLLRGTSGNSGNSGSGVDGQDSGDPGNSGNSAAGVDGPNNGDPRNGGSGASGNACNRVPAPSIQNASDPRLIPDRQRFASCPRNLQMDLEKLSLAGISFPTAQEGFVRSLSRSRP